MAKIKVVIDNKQKTVKVPTGIRLLMRRCCHAVLQLEEFDGDAEVRGKEARLQDGTLAGSVLLMRQALENLIHLFGIAPFDAVRMCTRTPAECIGEETLGRIVPGSPAPLMRWSKDWRFMNIMGG